MIRKTYLPRVLLPFGAILALGLDMVIGFALGGFLLIYYHRPVTAGLLLLPVFMVGCFMAASGLGLILSALNVRYRDVKYVVPFFTQMAFFLTPVIYPLSHIPNKLKLFLAVNPMAGMLEGTRFAVLGTPVSLPMILSSFAMSMALLVAGLYVFRRMERTFADAI
jgi:lipopolysaccharide transport system permease protein